MALPPASERGISQAPEIKLTHQLTGDEVHEIARRTGGVVKYSTSLRTYYGEMGRTAPARVKYPTLNAEINFVGYPTEVIYQTPGAYLNVDGEDFVLSLKNSAVVVGEDSVTFVHRPEAGLEKPSLNITTVTIKEDEVSFKRMALPLDGGKTPDEDILKAADLVDKAFRAVGR